MSKQKMSVVRRWWFLLGAEENGDVPYFIQGWDHYPNQQEIDSAVSTFNDEKLETYFLLEEVARGKASVLLKPVVEPKKEDVRKLYKMPPMGGGGMKI